MNDARPTLRDIAQRASDRHGGVRGRALDRVAKKQGLTLSYTTVDRILAGTYTSTPKAETLDALAELAGMDPAEVYAAAGLPVPMARFADQLPPDADLLTGAQRDAVIAVVRQFAAANKALHETRGGEGRELGSPSNADAGGPGAGLMDLDDAREERRRRLIEQAQPQREAGYDDPRQDDDSDD